MSVLIHSPASAKPDSDSRYIYLYNLKLTNVHFKYKEDPLFPTDALCQSRQTAAIADNSVKVNKIKLVIYPVSLTITSISYTICAVGFRVKLILLSA